MVHSFSTLYSNYEPFLTLENHKDTFYLLPPRPMGRGLSTNPRESEGART